MKSSIPFCIALVSCAVIAGSASAQARSQVAENHSAAIMELQAQQAALDDNWTAVASLAGKAYRQSASLNNEFNLATAYTHTGQLALAIPLYADVAANGRYVEATALYDYRSGIRPPRVQYNVADEANRRLELLTGQSAGQPSTNRGQVSNVVLAQPSTQPGARTQAVGAGSSALSTQ